MESTYLRGLNKLEVLHLQSNDIQFLNTFVFFEIKNLKQLFLGNNLIQSIEKLNKNLQYVANLELIDLSNNQIKVIDKEDFQYNTVLKSINMNANSILSIHSQAFEKIQLLESFKIAGVKSDFVLSNLKINNLIELDLMFNRIFINRTTSGKNYKMGGLKTIKAARVDFIGGDYSFEIFLNKFVLHYVDFSNNDLSNYFFLFKNMTQIETLILSNVQLSSPTQLLLSNFTNLKHLDLSRNNLIELDSLSFFRLNILEHLDLSYNQIELVARDFFPAESPCNMKYLNLAHNKISSLGSDLESFVHLEVLILSNNRIRTHPCFGQSTQQFKFNEYYLNNNNIQSLKYLSFFTAELIVLNIDSNQVDVIEFDALKNCRSLENLSLSRNCLNTIGTNSFYYLFSLKYLNLSYNRIENIEISSFQNLNKLESLDLSYNSQLKAIEPNVFLGLSHLKDLYLLNWRTFALNNASFRYLTNVSNVYLNESLVTEFKCIFMNSFERIVLRNVADIYIFYRSINLITLNYSLETKDYCEITFRLLQFNIHLNLKTDYENELFYEKCQDVLIRKKNSFTWNFKNCFENAILDDKIQVSLIEIGARYRLVLSDLYYLLSMGILALYLGLVCLHLVINLCQLSL